MSIVNVSAAILIREEKLLIAQRKKDKNEGLKWEFPGGKLEEGETPQQTLKREILEELSIEIAVRDIFDVVYYQYPTITILMLAFLCKYKAGDIQKTDCNDYRWIGIDEIDNYEFAQADIPIVEKLKKEWNIIVK